MQCHIHKVQNLAESIMAPGFWAEHISALIAFAKSLQEANRMRELREKLRLAFSDRLR